MNKPIPIFETIHEWDNVIRLTDKDDYQYECKNVGGFEKCLWDNHKFDREPFEYLKTKGFEQLNKSDDHKGVLIRELKQFFYVHPEKFDEYFKEEKPTNE